MAKKKDSTSVPLTPEEKRLRHNAVARASERRLRAADPARFHAKKARYRAANPDKLRAQERARYWADPEKARQKARNTYAKDPEASMATSRRWQAAHPEQVRQKENERYAANPLPKRQRTQQYKVDHPEKVRLLKIDYKNRRRARQVNAERNDLSVAQWQEVLEAFDYRCAYCHRKMARLSQDHITPFSRQGSHTLHNVVPACHSCNSKKHAGPVLSPVQPLLLTVAPTKKRKKP